MAICNNAKMISRDIPAMEIMAIDTFSSRLSCVTVLVSIGASGTLGIKGGRSSEVNGNNIISSDVYIYSGSGVFLTGFIANN